MNACTREHTGVVSWLQVLLDRRTLHAIEEGHTIHVNQAFDDQKARDNKRRAPFWSSLTGNTLILVKPLPAAGAGPGWK